MLYFSKKLITNLLYNVFPIILESAGKILVQTPKSTEASFLVVLADVGLVVPPDRGPQVGRGPHWSLAHHATRRVPRRRILLLDVDGVVVDAAVHLVIFLPLQFLKTTHFHSDDAVHRKTVIVLIAVTTPPYLFCIVHCICICEYSYYIDLVHVHIFVIWGLNKTFFFLKFHSTVSRFW